ncbi:pilus assembly PilX family protein [Alkalimarinus coralli]|uniref:pilus assembly PilX family protein n=1 Tax=Alkalimarinus coralli TaxID=2935863 RepID=UPI00202B4A19|nr:PilX N-terminal domain-containing pilus assembly protein [Alkalimarinus coralli]
MRQLTNMKQSGAALIVGLIMLLVMTMIGIAGMSETIMEDKMLFNFRDKTISLNAADSALRANEAWLADQDIKPTPQVLSNCSTMPLCGQTGNVVWDTNQLQATWSALTWSNWTTNAVEYSGSGASGSSIGNIAAQPRSIIEFRSFNEPTTTSSKGIATNLNAERSSQGIGWHYYNFYSASPGYRAETMSAIETTFQKWY